MAGELPGVKVEPVVWNLDLVAVDNLLLEDTVAVAQAVAPSGVVERGQTVEEAGSEATETAVSEGGIVLLLDEILDAETKAIETRLIRHKCQIMVVDRAGKANISSLTLGDVLQAHIENGVVQGTAHEELEGEIVDTLGVAECLALLGPVPLGDEAVAESQGGSRVGGRLVAVVQAAGEGSLDMADDLFLETLDVLEGLGFVLGPGRTLRLGDRGCGERLAGVILSAPPVSER